MPVSHPELLAPLNDWKTLTPKLKVLENADSVFFGIQSKFSMRARAGNFSIDELPRLSKQVHDQGAQLFLCTNIAIYNDEIQELRDTLEAAKSSEIDSIICYDFASIQIAKEIGMKFHISTQMNISNILSAKYFESVGASRINLARELSLNQIREISNSVKVPVECFIHGAMCTALSGRCYLSAELMGFSQSYSANRGKCGHQCRRFYTFVGEDGELLDYEPSTGRFFNAKDLCMIEHVDSLMSVNISAFKIEGRMRDPLYISETAKCYREAINSVLDGTYSDNKKNEWIKRLNKVYNRGFHTGFYFTPPDPRDVELRAKGNISLWKRKMIGFISGYSVDTSIASILMTSGSLQIGDTLIIQNDAGFYTTLKVSALLYERNSIQKTIEASSNAHTTASISASEVLPLNAKVFKIHQVQDPIKDSVNHKFVKYSSNLMDNSNIDANDLEKKLQELLREGLAQFYAGNYSQSTEIFLNAIPICKDLKFEKQYADLHMLVGKSYLLNKNYPEGRKYFKLAVELHKKIEKFSQVATDLENLADIHRLEYNYEISLDFYSQSLEYKRKAKNTSYLPEIYIKIATSYIYLKDYENAYNNFSNAATSLQDAEKTETSKILKASVFQGKGICASKLEWHQKAISHYEKALDLYDNLDDSSNKILILKLLGDGSYHSDEKDKALPYYQECIRIFEEAGKEVENVLEYIGSLYNSAEILIVENNYEESLKFTIQGLKISEDIQEEAWQLQFQLQKCVILIQTQKLQAARDLLKSKVVEKLIQKHGTAEERKLFDSLVELNDNAIIEMKQKE